MTRQSILVLGVGNILYTDEGLGVRALQNLERAYDFSPNVRLLDGGTQGYLLMGAMMECDKLIVLDAVRVVDKDAVRVIDKETVHVVDKDTICVMDKGIVHVENKYAGTIHILKGEDLRQSIAFSDSLHQTDLLDTLTMCELAGHRPETIIIGMEPEDITSQGLNLTPKVAAQMPEFCTTVLTAINNAGGQWQHHKTNNNHIQNAYVSASKS